MFFVDKGSVHKFDFPQNCPCWSGNAEPGEFPSGTCTAMAQQAAQCPVPAGNAPNPGCPLNAIAFEICSALAEAGTKLPKTPRAVGLDITRMVSAETAEFLRKNCMISGKPRGMER